MPLLWSWKEEKLLFGKWDFNYSEPKWFHEPFLSIPDKP